jgi:hypothetical protein
VAEGDQIIAAEQTLYQASRLWTHAGQEWEAAAAWLPAAVLSQNAFGHSYHFGAAGYVAAYNECVAAIRDKLLEGAENLHAVARALHRSAQQYVEVDEELTDRVDRLIRDRPEPGTPEQTWNAIRDRFS